MCNQLDQLTLNFSPTSLWWLDITLTVIMFGVALNLRLGDFRAVMAEPKAPALGLLSQLVVLPAVTLLLVWVVEPCPSLALGMFLVAACPGGNISNFMSLLARGNVALSVSLSALTTLLSVVVTPFNFAFWSGLYGPTRTLMSNIEVDPVSIFLKILIILALPLAIGMWTAHRFPRLAAQIGTPLRRLSILIFGAYVFMALYSNFDAFLNFAKYVVLLVAAHNFLALFSGYTVGKIGGLDEPSRRTLSIETGIQNSGLALVLIFSPLFDGLGGMALIAAMWGLWHIVAGLTLATIWSYSAWLPKTVKQ